MWNCWAPSDLCLLVSPELCCVLCTEFYSPWNLYLKRTLKNLAWRCPRTVKEVGIWYIPGMSRDSKLITFLATLELLLIRYCFTWQKLYWHKISVIAYKSPGSHSCSLWGWFKYVKIDTVCFCLLQVKQHMSFYQSYDSCKGLGLNMECPQFPAGGASWEVVETLQSETLLKKLGL